MKKDVSWRQKICNHIWKKVVLVTSTVEHCIICDVHKEDLDDKDKKELELDIDGWDDLY